MKKLVSKQQQQKQAMIATYILDEMFKDGNTGPICMSGLMRLKAFTERELKLVIKACPLNSEGLPWAVGLALWYEFGQEGMPRNYEKARFWYEHASAQGDVLATSQLQFMYERGLGVPRNLERAELYRETAALYKWAHANAEKQNREVRTQYALVTKPEDVLKKFLYKFTTRIRAAA